MGVESDPKTVSVLDSTEEQRKDMKMLNLRWIISGTDMEKIKRSKKKPLVKIFK